ncbi:MAG: hypothetical protein M3R53_00445 [Candidatus Eremiobacteraeota bacterium]|nr:hypothetical protein [Candidatus Eremiobacteraeota bacterium]
MFWSSKSTKLRVRATAATALFAVAAAGAGQAAVTTGRPGTMPSPVVTLSRLSAVRAPQRGAAGTNTATLPLYAPWGMTLAPSGDLYVANLLANQVLVYDRNLVQKTSSTIATGLSHPSAVAFDSTGEVYVSNVASNTINVYSPNHTYLPTRTIVANVTTPTSIAIDGLDNLYVDENYAAIGVYDFHGSFVCNLPFLSNLGGINAFAQRAHFSAVAGAQQVQFIATAAELETISGNGGFPSGGIGINDPLAVAFDGSDNLYYVAGDLALRSFNTSTSAQAVLATLPFVPAAMAVDSIRGRIFVSDLYHNAIAVYSLTGQLLQTLH